jgi:urate oxidase
MAKLGENRYGKSRVRLARVKRGGDGHEVREWAVQILLQGDFESCFTDGDNSKILPTDTMKNTVYSLARTSSFDCIEEFGQELVDFFLARNSQVSEVEVDISETVWDHALVGGAPHPSTFVHSGAASQTTQVKKKRDGKFLLVSGIENLVLLKTAGSAFEGFIRDTLTTLPETKDRLFSTALRANWTYLGSKLDFASLRARIGELLLAAFARHRSKSVQHTLYDMGQSVLGAMPEVKDIELVMPNKHYLPVDLSRFGQDNPNEIFVPTDEPHGYIEARVSR